MNSKPEIQGLQHTFHRTQSPKETLMTPSSPRVTELKIPSQIALGEEELRAPTSAETLMLVLSSESESPAQSCGEMCLSTIGNPVVS